MSRFFFVESWTTNEQTSQLSTTNERTIINISPTRTNRIYLLRRTHKRSNDILSNERTEIHFLIVRNNFFTERTIRTDDPNRTSFFHWTQTRKQFLHRWNELVALSILDEETSLPHERTRFLRRTSGPSKLSISNRRPNKLLCQKNVLNQTELCDVVVITERDIFKFVTKRTNTHSTLKF